MYGRKVNVYQVVHSMIRNSFYKPRKFVFILMYISLCIQGCMHVLMLILLKECVQKKGLTRWTFSRKWHHLKYSLTLTLLKTVTCHVSAMDFKIRPVMLLFDWQWKTVGPDQSAWMYMLIWAEILCRSDVHGKL